MFSFISVPSSVKELAEPSFSISRILGGAYDGPRRKDELASKGIPIN